MKPIRLPTLFISHVMVAAGAAGNDIGYRIFTDTVFEVAMASYRFG
jgi:hypothetical protein